MACPHVGTYTAEFERRLQIFCCLVCVSYPTRLSIIGIFLIRKTTNTQTAGIAALFWDQQPNMTTQELWNKITATASTGAVKNAMGPVDSVATTVATFTTEPATKNPFKVCPLPPRPLAPTPTPPSTGSSEDEGLSTGVIIIVSLLIMAVAAGVGCWCLGQLKSGHSSTY
jgi:hypothetical protein